MVTMPSSAICWRSRRVSRSTTPRREESTSSMPDGTLPAMEMLSGVRATTSPLLMITMFSSGTPMLCAVWAWRTNMRCSPWTGKKNLGRVSPSISF